MACADGLRFGARFHLWELNPPTHPAVKFTSPHKPASDVKGPLVFMWRQDLAILSPERPATTPANYGHPGRNYIRPPPSLHFLAKKHFSGEGGGGVYSEPPRSRNFIRPPPLKRPPPLEGYFQGWGGGGV